jgi:hypothetical protein
MEIFVDCEIALWWSILCFMVSEEIIVTTQVKFDVMMYCMTHLTSHETFQFWCVYVDVFDIVHSLR